MKDIFKAMGVVVASDRSLVETTNTEFAQGQKIDNSQPVRKGLGMSAYDTLQSQLAKGGISVMGEVELKRVSPHAKEEDESAEDRREREAKADKKFKEESAKKYSYEDSLKNTHGENWHDDVHESADEVSQSYEVDREFEGEKRPAKKRDCWETRGDAQGEKSYEYDFKSMSAEDYLFLKAMGENFEKAEKKLEKRFPMPPKKPSMTLKIQPKSPEEAKVQRQLKREQMGLPVKKSIENTLDSLIEMLPDNNDPSLIANIHENSEGMNEKRVAKGRCWEGYKPVKGKAPYSEGSCAKKGMETDYDHDGKLDQHEKDHAEMKKLMSKKAKKSEDEDDMDKCGMNKAKTAVGKKISKLVGEGKPQKQAVAIALQMERTGKLGSQGGYKKSFVKASGPGGMIFDFGTSTGNPIADSATALLNANADYIQSQNADYQSNAYQSALMKFVTAGEAAYMGQTTPFGNITEQGASMINKPMDQQVKEAYERGEFGGGATSVPGMAKSSPVVANATNLPQDRSIPNIPNFEKSNTTVGGVQVHAQSPTDAAVIEMMKGYFEGQNDSDGFVADVGTTGKVSVIAGE